MKLIAKKIGNAKSGSYALSAAQKAAADTGNDAFFSNHIGIIRVQPTGLWSIGKIGDYGFCSRVAKIAERRYGVWIED